MAGYLQLFVQAGDTGYNILYILFIIYGCSKCSRIVYEFCNVNVKSILLSCVEKCLVIIDRWVFSSWSNLGVKYLSLHISELNHIILM